MRIVECIHNLRPGGAQRLLVDLSNELSDTDEVVILTLKNRPERMEDFYFPKISKNVRFVSLNLSDGFRVSYLWKVYKTVESLDPDIVHIHCIVHYFLPAILFYRRCRYVQTLHNEAKYGVVRYLRNIWKRLLQSKLLHLVTISRTNRESFRQCFRLACDTLIYNGCPQPEKSERFDATAAFVERLKKYPDDKLLLCIARSAPQKNIGMLVSVVNELADRGEHLQLIIIGDHDTEEGRQWMASAGSSVHFIGVKDNVADYLCLCDAFCLSSLWEGMPITLIEALSCRCIPVCTPCSGIVDVVENGRTGFIARSFSEKDYRETVIDFLENRNRIDREDLYGLYRSRFSIKRCAVRYRRLFENLSSGTRPESEMKVNEFL